MTLYEVTAGAIGESYVRAYAWADSIERACELFRARNPGLPIRSVTVLIRQDEGPFCSLATDDGSDWTH